jgi:phage baseplate assembly protein W
VKCHGSADIVQGQNRDWARVSGNQYLIQKLKLFMMIPKGEVINEPDMGCCLYSYLFDKLTDQRLVEMRLELEYDLRNQLHELGVQQVLVNRNQPPGDAVNIQILSRTGTWLLQASRDDLLSIDLLNAFGGTS